MNEAQKNAVGSRIQANLNLLKHIEELKKKLSEQYKVLELRRVQVLKQNEQLRRPVHAIPEGIQVIPQEICVVDPKGNVEISFDMTIQEGAQSFFQYMRGEEAHGKEDEKPG